MQKKNTTKKSKMKMKFFPVLNLQFKKKMFFNESIKSRSLSFFFTINNSSFDYFKKIAKPNETFRWKTQKGYNQVR